VERLEAEHDELMGRWADLPTPRARDKAKARFAELEERIEQVRRQQEDVAAVVEKQYRAIKDLQMAVEDAKRAMQSESDAQALRQRAEALRGILCRIECEFVLTGKAKTCTVKGTIRNIGGAGNTRSRLVAVSFVPVAGDGLTIPVESGNETCGNRSTPSPGTRTALMPVS
jgi:hypothetical protein